MTLGRETHMEKDQQLIAGEVHILVDQTTGAISVNAPANMVVALGLIEMAKIILADNHKANLAAAPRDPQIIKAGMEALDKLKASVRH
jgi:hypothetical protein